MKVRVYALRARAFGGERGQTLALFGMVLPAVVAILSMVLDGGQLLATRSRAQNTVDAAALAAAQDLPNAAAAKETALAYLAKAGLETTRYDVIVTSSGGNANHAVTVTVEADAPLAFAGFLGISPSVGATATVTRAMMHSAGSAIVPWAIVSSQDPNSAIRLNPCYKGDDGNGLPIMQTRQNCILKYGSGYGTKGDFGPIRLVQSATGGEAYYTHLAAYQGGIHRIGDPVWPASGNLVGATRDGVMHRLGHIPGQTQEENATAPRCWHNVESDTEMLTECPGVKRNQMLQDNADRTTSVVTGCETSKRLAIIPIVDTLAGGQTTPATIRGFALFYIKGMLGPDGTIHETESASTNGLDTVVGEFITTMWALPGAEYGSGPATGPGILRFVQ